MTALSHPAVAAAHATARAALDAETAALGHPPPLTTLHARGAEAARAGEPARAAALYTLALELAASARLTHRDLHVTQANAASAWLALGAWEDATRCARAAAEGAAAAASAGRAPPAAPARPLALLGAALAGRGDTSAGLAALEAALALDPSDPRIRARHGEAVRRAQGEGEGSALVAAPQKNATPPPPPPLLPTRLLTPAAARRNPATRDTLTHLEVACDTAAPGRALRAVADAGRVAALEAAVGAAVGAVAASGAAPAILDLGGGLWAGGLSAAGVRAGARRAAVVEPRLYLAEAAREAVDGGWVGGSSSSVARTPTPASHPPPAGDSGTTTSISSRITVLHHTPTALRRGAPTNPPPSNLIILAGLITDCGLGGGVLPSLAAATAAGLVVGGCGRRAGAAEPSAPAVAFVPATLTYHFQLASVHAAPSRAAGLDVRPLDAHRSGSPCSGGWGPGGVDGGPHGGGALWPGDWVALSGPAPVPGLAIDFARPPATGGEEALPVRVTAPGTANAVVAWVEWGFGVGGPPPLTDARPQSAVAAVAAAASLAATGPRPPGAGPPSVGPVLFYLGGEVEVVPGQTLDLRVAHNTVRNGHKGTEGEGRGVAKGCLWVCWLASSRSHCFFRPQSASPSPPRRLLAPCPTRPGLAPPF